MEIVKAFEHNELSMNITIKGSHEDPLFRASDVAEILEISNIRQNIQHFDETEKRGVCLTDAIGRSQETTFLTEKGLYKVLFKSRKSIAIQFQNWVCDVIKEIRLNGSYELKKQLEEKDQEIKKIITEKDAQRENIILDNFDEKTAVYIAYADNAKKIGRPGLTSRVAGRLAEHKATYGKDFKYEYIHESPYAAEIERRLFRNPEMIARRFTKEFSGKNRTELFHLDETFTLADINKLVIQIKKEVELEEYNKDKDAEIANLKLEISNSKLEISNLTLKIVDIKKNYEEQIKYLKNDMVSMAKLKPENERLKQKLKELAKEEKIEKAEIEQKIKLEITPPVILEQEQIIKSLKNSLSHMKKEFYFIARNIITKEEKIFKSYDAVHEITKIGPHSVKDNYLDKPKQCRGWTFRTENKPYWQPPTNFIFNPEQKSSTHMEFCKSIHKTTKEVTYYNSGIEVAWHMHKLDPDNFPVNDTNRRAITHVLQGNKTMKFPLCYYDWNKVEKCGTWVFPDGHTEDV